MWVCLEESGGSSSVGLDLCEECAVGLEVKEGRPRRTVRRASSRLEDKRSSWERLLGVELVSVLGLFGSGASSDLSDVSSGDDDEGA